MKDIPAWLSIAALDLTFFVAGISALWFFARRELQADVSERPRRPRRSIMRVLEYRLEQLLLHPPRWDQIWPRIRPYVLGVGSLAVVGVAVWALISWLSAPLPPPRPTSGLATMQPFEAAAEHASRLMAKMSLVIGLLGFVGTGFSILVGDGRRASMGLALVIVAFAMRGVPVVFGFQP